jgi:hypothetical protein
MITREEAKELARAECERRGLGFDEPVRVIGGPLRYRIWTRSNARGGNVIVSVHRWNGETEVVAVTPK